MLLSPGNKASFTSAFHPDEFANIAVVIVRQIAIDDVDEETYRVRGPGGFTFCAFRRELSVSAEIEAERVAAARAFFSREG